MTFLAPLLLVGLASLAVPILLHLLRRRETRSLDFPALRYLTRTTREQARIIRLRQLLLLALRLTALLLLVLAGARLVLPLGGSDHPPAGVAIVIDNGLTSGAIAEGERVLDAHLAGALQALDRMGERDLVWIVPAGEPWAAALPVTPAEAGERLAGIEPTHVTPDLPAALERAAALLEAGAPPLREILLLSDLRPEALPPPEATASPRAIPVRVRAPEPAPPPNRGIAEVVLSGGLTPRAGEPGELLVRVAGAETAGVVVRAYIEGQLVSTVRTGGDGMALLPLPPAPDGWVRGRVEIDPDDLRGDDVAHLAFRAIPPPRVATLGALPPFIEDALDVLADGGRIERTPQGTADVVFLGGGAPPPGAGDGRTLVLVPPEEPAGLAALNLLLSERGTGWRYEATTPIAGEGRAITGGESRDALPLLPPVRHAHRLVSEGNGAPATPLLTLSDGTPWLLRIQGEGPEILALASPLTPAASGIPASAAMIPLVDLLTTGAGRDPAPGGVAAGTPLTLPRGTVTVRLPDGTLRPHAGMDRASRTGVAGVHEFLDAEGTLLGMAAVNARAPTDGPPLGEAEAVERLRTVWTEAETGSPWPDAVLEDRRGREAWRFLLAALLLVLVAEGWLASWGGEGPTRKRGSPPAERGTSVAQEVGPKS